MPSETTGISRGFWLSVLAIFLALYGIATGAGGVRLITLGGSWYYLISGIALLISGILLWRQRMSGAWWFASVLALSIIWTIWERGLAYWAWVARLDFLVPLALVLALLLPRLSGGVSRRLSLVLATFPAAVIVLGAAAAFLPGRSDVAAGTFPDKPLVTQAQTTTDAPDSDWVAFGRDKNATRFSPLTQLTAENVGGLKKVWEYRTGDMTPPGQVNVRGAETTPLKIGDGVYLCSALNDIVKLDPRTGKEVWRYESGVEWQNTRFAATCRSLAYYVSPTIPEGEPCHDRLIEATVNDAVKGWRLIAVDMATGKACTGFGNDGQVDLLAGMGRAVPGMVSEGAPPAIVDGVVVTNHEVLDGQLRDAPSGVIRGYSAETGDLLWAWDVKRPDRKGLPPEGETYSPGTPNSWGALVGDDKLGLVYVPTGNAAIDYYSALRSPEENAVSSAVVALDVHTGTQRWVFQTVHKDVWDYDIGSQATLFDFPAADGGSVPALIMPTKRGQTFVLDRRTGKPLTEVEERPAPTYNEVTEDPHPATQPWSVGMPRLGIRDFTESFAWGLTPLDQLYCRIKFRKARYDGEFTNPTVSQPWLQYPGNNGGVDWGSMAYDPQTGVLVSNWNIVAMYNQLLPRDDAERRGLQAYDDPNWRPGGGGAEGPGAQVGAPYAISVEVFDNPLTGVLCYEPPYGMISAIDMHTRKVLWEQPLGTARANGPFGIETGLPIQFGVPSNGGPIITAGGLIFIAAATDNLIRAIDIRTGKVVWSDVLPAGGQATPMTYETGGRQYLVIMAGGHHYMHTAEGDYFIAYALPEPVTN
ncbi:membrane-bound PQQ-dependent dehydrogenase, glucose/quinate/shikimate family [Paenirhodobacter populi]|uniref:Membrane-bound PQQ-dependent dehydrogenase, glucose/quinate/shikimate family n=1 Tax=Paenirhodobacter populi TaxID=2306993 RepID=A0A443J9I0_9RHOB|nr:membrane-bound PQQ-dependent dehydrogenase, glucose/quinate/shikimate family [Sinirhodobacter populi]RWR17155.1 membrane-bound PQQ-dependent dehydrogenase, glucose/quinate/shikimate family [Sinirhodobacter populi]